MSPDFKAIKKDILKEIEKFVLELTKIIPKDKLQNEEMFLYFELICQLVGLHLKEVYEKERFELLRRQTKIQEEKDANGILAALENPSALLQKGPPGKKIH